MMILSGGLLIHSGGASDLRDFLVFSHYAALSKKVLIHLDVGGGIVEGVNEQILHLETVNGTGKSRRYA